MNLERQDRNGVRTPTDVQRRMKNKQVESNTKKIEQINRERAVDTALSSISENPVQNKVITKALENKIEKTEGKGLSDKNFTAEYEEKLKGIENNAQANIIEEISVDNTLYIPEGKRVNIDIFKQINIEDNKGLIWYSNGLLIQYGMATSEEAIDVYYDLAYDYSPNLQITPLSPTDFFVDIESNEVFTINGTGKFLWQAIGLKK